MRRRRRRHSGYRGIFGADFYLELQDHGLLEQRKVMPEMLKLSRETGIQLVVTNDVHYVRSRSTPCRI
ncbi:hypothetical protein [Paenibacillus silviterrae]|uniref:hypothetical protein n=1 Tax=Paenibacillus silviterrae TaxID=3242194 RepID=UPI00254316CD|nr:hypothetical protein [Paenibacillus chinjuensis]